MLHIKHITLVWKLKRKIMNASARKWECAFKIFFIPILCNWILIQCFLFSRFHIGEYVCPLFTVNCRVFKFPSKMQAETGQIGNGLKLTKKAKKRLWKFHVVRARENHEKTTWKYIQVILSAIQKKIYTSFFAYLCGHSTTT